MIQVVNNRIHVATHAAHDEWHLRLRNRILVLSAAASNTENGPAIIDALGGEILALLEIIPSEDQMALLLSLPDTGPKGSAVSDTE